MRRRDRVLFGSAIAALVGGALLFAAIGWLVWRESVATETSYAGSLAASLGQRAEGIFVDTRDLLAGFDRLDAPRCSADHLRALQHAAISRPYIRAIGYWQASERRCGVGFLPPEGLKPARADRIYDTGVIAWWPNKSTEVGGVQLFLMRYGNHDVAIDPRLLLDVGPLQQRRAGLWVEKLRLSASPWDAQLPLPDAVGAGVTVDRGNGVVVSRFSRDDLLPIDVVAVEPLDSVWNRHASKLIAGAAFALVLAALWILLVLRYSRHQLSLATELRRAVAGEHIRVQYQPVVDLSTGLCVGAEVLARWTRDDGEVMRPDVFIALAEEAGFIQDVTLAVMRIAVRDLAQLRREFPDVAVNLNLAPADLQDERVGTTLASSLAAAGLPPDAIKLEITERALVNSNTSRALIREFRRRGHQVAVDDFGTGYSSLSYLQTFELDVLKIDKSFVDAIGTQAATSQVIVHVIEMARSLGLATVAEGVETPEQERWLVEHGVAFGQGYYYSKPLDLGGYVEFLRRRRTHAAA